MRAQSPGCRVPTGWQEAPLHFPPPLLPLAGKRTHWDHTVRRGGAGSPRRGQALGHIWAAWTEGRGEEDHDPETFTF